MQGPKEGNRDQGEKQGSQKDRKDQQLPHFSMACKRGRAVAPQPPAFVKHKQVLYLIVNPHQKLLHS